MSTDTSVESAVVIDKVVESKSFSPVRTSGSAGFLREITQWAGVDLEFALGRSQMVFSTIHQGALPRLLAVLIVVFFVSAYSEPLAAMNGTDGGNTAAVDVGDATKIKASALPELAPAVVVILLYDVSLAVARHVEPRATLLAGDRQRAILRI